MLKADSFSLEWWHGLQTDGGDACTDYDTISATDLHKRRWIMQVCFSSSTLHFYKQKAKPFFDLPPPTLKKSWGPLFRELRLTACSEIHR